ncbi:hypothetical protein DXT99_12420 [Pontibacter diazotrophicus]|uniref:Uncharacterized protein n=1 Tax=Pontibacter diazotrophicus TaxID=1400979 RepID=A0A3D8LBI7_9BACT|nr:hypothetical protein [Pontibacter diazotrophicus]RDV14768.1 hypothetical protein DXT99_12420 [Pontibacter diazotrophicus]
MRKLSIWVIAGILFSAIGMVSLFMTREALTAAIWLSFGNGLILSDLRFSATDEKGKTYVKPVPKARYYTAIFLIVFAILLLALQVYLDVQAAGANKVN